ncbi:MAG TPA: thioredoxin family protein [Candidatus Acidoferrales bacterium]|nr:thioredoxin family protein [Candidatus Acidoferrales bacterium]
MNRRIRWTLAALLALAPLAGLAPAARAQGDDAGPKALALGSVAPMRDAAMKSVDGKPVSIASAAGPKGTLVLFICNHCPWVKAWQSRIAELGNAAARQGVGVIAINSNDPVAYPEDDYDGMVARAKEVGYTFAYVVDATSDVARAFGATHTPEAFLFDARGKLVYHGAVDDNAHDASAVHEHWLADAVSAVAAGKPVATAESKAMGCGIRYRAEKSQ